MTYTLLFDLFPPSSPFFHCTKAASLDDVRYYAVVVTGMDDARIAPASRLVGNAFATC